MTFKYGKVNINTMKIIVGLIASIVLIILIMFFINPMNILNFDKDRTSETALIQEKLVELSEWTTLRYEYSNVIVSRVEQSITIFGIPDINYAETIKLIEYSGYLKAGTDMSKVEITFDSKSEKLYIRVPKSKILDNVVETENTRVEDLIGNIFSDYPSQIIFDEINENKKRIEEEKIEQGFLEEADKRIKELLIAFLNSSGFDDIEIEFY